MGSIWSQLAEAGLEYFAWELATRAWSRVLSRQERAFGGLKQLIL